MPYPFVIPTTSSLSFASHFNSNTHPSLPFSATTSRACVRDALKRHKRLPSHVKAADLSNLLSALEEYMPYLFALDVGLSGGSVAQDEVDVILASELDFSWTSILSCAVPGRQPQRVRLRSLEHEIDFALSTLAFVTIRHARAQLLALHGLVTLTPDARRAAITSAVKDLLTSSGIYRYLLQRSSELTLAPPTIDVSSPVFSALAELFHGEATLLAVLKDDPYPAVTGQGRNENDLEWMIKAPDLPKVRAHLFARLCLAAADRAGQASATLQHLSRTNEALVDYAGSLREVARAKACRFFAIDADLSGKTAEAIAWLRAARGELRYGAAKETEDGRTGKLSRWRRGRDEKKEDKKIQQGGEWGRDAGKLEEGRVLDMLESKWVKMNETYNTQVIPSSDHLLASMPTGREIHSMQLYRPPVLDKDVLAKMRAPAGAIDSAFDEIDDDSDDDAADNPDAKSSFKDLPGAFPSAGDEYSAEGSYY